MGYLRFEIFRFALVLFVGKGPRDLNEKKRYLQGIGKSLYAPPADKIEDAKTRDDTDKKRGKDRNEHHGIIVSHYARTAYPAKAGRNKKRSPARGARGSF